MTRSESPGRVLYCQHVAPPHRWMILAGQVYGPPFSIWVSALVQPIQIGGEQLHHCPHYRLGVSGYSSDTLGPVAASIGEVEQGGQGLLFLTPGPLVTESRDRSDSAILGLLQDLTLSQRPVWLRDWLALPAPV